MRNAIKPFQFDMSKVVSHVRRLRSSVDGVAINLPFVSISLKPDTSEQKAAREIAIRLKDKRVLNARECCDDCIDRALASIQEIRSLLLDKQVELAHLADGPTFLVVEAMAEGIRQFLTFEQRLDRTNPQHRESYYAALEMLRQHLHQSLTQVAAVANIPVAQFPSGMTYDAGWQLKSYRRLAREPEE